MAPQQVQWGTITLYLDAETFRKSFTNGRSMYFDDSEYAYPHVAHQMNTLEAIGSVLNEDGKGSYRFPPHDVQKRYRHPGFRAFVT